MSNELLRDVSTYLTIDQVIVLSMTSTPSLFFGLNNLRFKRFIPSYNEANPSSLSKLIYYNVSERETLRAIKECKDLNCQDENYDKSYYGTPLRCAAYRNNFKIVKALLKTGSKPSLYGAYNGEMAKLLIEAGADVNSGGCLHHAVCTGFTDYVNVLINAGSDVNSYYDTGRGIPSYPLSAALSFYHYQRSNDIIEALVKNGANPNLTIPQFGGDKTIFYGFIEMLDISLIGILMEANVDPNVRDANGVSALDYAKRFYNDRYNPDNPEMMQPRKPLDFLNDRATILNIITVLENFNN